MNLHPEWRSILKYAWSARLMIAAGVLEFVAFVTSALIGWGFVSVILAIVGGLAQAGALIARVMLQANYPVRE